MNKEFGRSGADAPSGCQPSASAAPLCSASSQSGIPNAGMFSGTIYASCPICYGSRVAFDGPCITCADPEPARVRQALEQLTPEQMAFLRAYGHTLAYQPVTREEYDAHCVEFYVEEWDGEFDEDEGFWIIPNTRLWFAGGCMRFGPCGTLHSIHYNPLGLALRESLMAGADARVRHASRIEARSDETPKAAQPEGREPDPAEQGDAQPSPGAPS